MNNFIKERGVDILSILFISAVNIFTLTSFYNAANIMVLLSLTAACSLVAIFYKNNVSRFIVNVIIATVLFNVILTLLPNTDSESRGWLPLLFVINVFDITEGAFLGFIFIKIYYFLVGDRISPVKNKIILAAIFISVIVYIGVFLFNQTEKTNVILIRSEFIKRVATAIGEGKLVQFNNKELIDLGIVSGFYKNNGEQIINDFGSLIQIKKEGQDVDITYEGVPSKDQCYNFYFMNDPYVYGFNITKIDGIKKKSNMEPTTSAEIEAFKEKVCYSGKDKVTIEYIGSVGNIIESAKYFNN